MSYGPAMAEESATKGAVGRWKAFFAEMAIWRLLRALRRNFAAWTVLFFSTGIKALVNQVEQPFARSLIACSTPVDPDVYTGSRWCGDRLEVIQSGMYLSAVGQGQENMAMLCSLTFVIILTGVSGPRVSLLLGLCGVTISVLLFVVASSSHDLGRGLFALGQGLQGLYPVDYLIGILMLHMGMLPESDGEANYQIMTYMFIFSNIFWNMVLGNGVAMLELTDYRGVWMTILATSVSVLLLAIFGFPEMKPLGSEQFQGKSPFRKVVQELLSYKDLAYDWRARRFLVKMFFENMTVTFHYVATAPSLMAYHGWTQPQLTVLMLLPQIIELVMIPYYKSVLIRRVGFFQTYVWSVRFVLLGSCWALTALVWTDKWFLVWMVMKTLLAGFNPLKGFVDSRFSEPEQMQRFQSVQWVMGYFLGMWSGPMYAARFNAAGQTAWERSTPFLIFLVWVSFQWWSVFCLIYDMDGVHGFAVTVRVLDDLEKKGKELWHLVGADSGTAEFACITEEKWNAYGLEPFLGKSAHELGMPIYSFSHWEMVIGMMNSTPSQGHILVSRLEAAITHAKQVQQNYMQAPVQLSEFPELEGHWVPIRPYEWMRPHEALHPQSLEVWGSNGEGHFENGDWEAGILKVLQRQDSKYFCSYKLLTGSSAGMEGHIVMHLLEDGTRWFESPSRHLMRKEAYLAYCEAQRVQQEAAGAREGGAAAPEEGAAPRETGAEGPAASEGGPGGAGAPAPGTDAPAPGADAPAPEGKKDA